MLDQLRESKTGEYICGLNLNLYKSPTSESLVTQAAKGRHLQILSPLPKDGAVLVRLCEDGYPGWLRVEEVAELEPALQVYHAIAVSPEQIPERIPTIIAFTKQAMAQPNYYLWGGTVGPNYDCSGLMQAAFSASGIWLPRDSYQQVAFTQSIEIEQLQPGDLVFFSSGERVNHVGLYLGEGHYIHSSGKDRGRNGIGIDLLSADGDNISQSYYQQLRGAGRVVASYQPLAT